ncbi:right-handed parallel beta-helix repeat-containing protein [Taibaiella chishuiensis]|nr:right-handed parallel beta-helix repeat-containing protein [Taibaiella chishuiensis]
MFKRFFVFVMLLVCIIPGARATVIYVDSNQVAGIQNGLSWATAFRDFQAGIDAAVPGDSLFVAAGSYQPAAGASFIMKEGVKLFGGFTNTMPAFAGRNWQQYKVTLRGNNAGVIRNNGNGLTAAARLDGFYITGGKADAGAGMYNNDCSPSIVNCYFSGDTATGKGGGLYNRGASGPDIINCTFANNMATYGGAMYNDSFTMPNIVNTIVSANRAAFTAGISNIYATPVLTGCTFTGNVSTNWESMGAGVQNWYSPAVITNCTFNANKGQGLNPAMDNGSGGGAIANYRSNATISFCNFSNNEANYGGGIYNNLSVPQISNCNFTSNTAADGGGISSYYSSVYVAHCDFRSNYVYGSGGAGAQNMLGSSTFVNCLFARNSCGAGPGGGISDYVGRIKLVNCTIAFNWASYGAGMGGYGSDFSITNTIMYGNGSNSLTPAPAAGSVRYSMIHGMAADAVNHNLDGNINPLFINNMVNNFRLQATSPCIDAGTNDSIAGFPADLEGNTRILGGTVDMGAYENAGSPLALQLVSFNGTRVREQAHLLTWVTADERELSGFELQRSADGFGFLPLHTLPVKGYGAGRYNFEDQYPLPVNYYRLMLVHTDGSRTYSDVLKMDLARKMPASKVYPNPARESVTLVPGDRQLIGTRVVLLDIYGRSRGSWTLDGHSNTLPLAGLAPGIYVLQLENGELLKIVKE